jgi:hypothetical protein
MTMVAPPRHGGARRDPHLHSAPLPRLDRRARRGERRHRLPAAGRPRGGTREDPAGTEKTLSIEHPSGEMSVVATMDGDEVKSVAVLRTARKLFDGVVFG